MFNLMVMPASPALAVELAPNDAASRALLAAARTLAVEAAAAGMEEAEIIGSRSSRWRTRHTGSLRAWSPPGKRGRGRLPARNHGPLRPVHGPTDNGAR